MITLRLGKIHFTVDCEGFSRKELMKIPTRSTLTVYPKTLLERYVKLLIDLLNDIETERDKHIKLVEESESIEELIKSPFGSKCVPKDYLNQGTMRKLKRLMLQD